jgi:CubicO group peptidase (beta-lactamase class C family)
MESLPARSLGRRSFAGLLASLALLLLPTPAPAQEPPPDLPPEVAAGWEETADWLTGELESQGVVGASLYMTYGGRTVRHLHFGMADRDEGRPVDADTIFHWGSITKTLTAVAVMQLRDRGRLDLDAPAVDYLPELRAVHDPFGPIEEVTIRHLLGHTSGFQAPTWPWDGGEEWQPFEPTSWDQLVAMLPYMRLWFEPGSRFGYSNPAFIYLAEIVERITGDDFEVYVEKNILRPLEMRSTYYDTTPYHLLHRRSNRYLAEGGAITPRVNAQGLDFDTGITAANGGLNASVPDLVRWLEMLLGYGPGIEPTPAAPDGVIAHSTLEEMWQARVAVSEEEGQEEHMGLSFFLPRRDGRESVGHTGTQGGFAALFYLDPANDAGVVAAFNTYNATAEDVPNVYRLRLDLKERLLTDVLGRFPPSEPTE